MKKSALLISLFTLIFAFTVSTASAQKVTSAKDAPAKSCCAKADAKSTAACAKSGDASASAGCSKTCSKAEAKSCSNKGTTTAEVAPVPKKN